MSLFFLLGRLLYGGYFVMMGIKHFRDRQMMVGYAKSKGMSAPMAGVILSGVLLVLSGVSIITGFWIKGAVAFLVVFLLLVSLIMHAFWKDTDPMTKMSNQVNFMKNMALLGATLMLPMIPEPWLWSIMAK